MLTKLAEILLSAKSSAVSGVLILAGGAVVSASSGAGGFLANEQPEPTPLVEVVDDVEDEELEFELEDEEEPAEEPAEEVEELPISEQDCQNEESARAGAQARIDAAFRKYDRGLDELRGKLDGKGSAGVYEAIESAKALLVEIRTSALEAFADATLCNVRVASVGQVGFRGGAAAVMEIAEHAVAAMETVYNLARSTVLKEIERLKPTPTPKQKATPKPKTEFTKPSKAPSCEDAMYAAKKRLHKAFEQYHGGHDKLMKELKGWASESSMRPFWETDSLLHQTYDRTRERIIDARCATGEDSAMALAEHAEILFREAYNASKAIFVELVKDKPDHEGCEDHMYAAKQVMYEAFEKWHGANDKLIHGLKGWAGEGAIDAAKAADGVIHETFDTTKHKIIEAACSKEHEAYVMGLARAAAQAFQAAHQNALFAVAEELKKSGDDD